MKGNRWRVYLNPFDDFGNYTGYQEVTDYCEIDSLGTIDQALDNTDYNIGIYRTANFSVTFRNDTGKFSDVGQPGTIFRYTRSNSLFKITWQGEIDDFKCGFFKAGNKSCAPEQTVFIGLLSDKDLSVDLATEELQFTVLGRETSLSTTFVAQSQISATGLTCVFSGGGTATITATAHGLVVGNPIQFSTTVALPTEITAGTTYYVVTSDGANTFTISSSKTGSGQTFATAGTGTAGYVKMFGLLISSVMKNILNQSGITNYLTYSATNINLGTDLAMDDTSSATNNDVWDVMQDLLLLSNSVLYVQNDGIVVAPRTVGANVAYTFLGQASILGPENIQDIQNIVSGRARTFNYLSWTPSNVFVQNSQSITLYGATQKSFDQTYITNPTNQASILNGILNEFGLPKQEFDLYTPIGYDTMALFFLNKIALDVPPQTIATAPNQLPICGQAICGSAVLGTTYSGFVETPNNFYKIEGTSIDPQTDLICFSMRRV